MSDLIKTILQMFKMRDKAVALRVCASCLHSADRFRDAESLREFGFSGLCQDCQDEIFGRG
jgi:hypothetical protein